MTPVKQTIFGAPDGNCFAACVASILDLPLVEVPLRGDENWFKDAEVWLRERDIDVIFVDLRKSEGGKMPQWIGDQIYWIASGPAARGLPHAVVMKGHDFCHDPHPDDTFISDCEDAIFLVPTVYPTAGAVVA